MIDKRIDGSPADQLRLRHLRHQLDWSPRFDQELRPVSGSPCSDEGLHQTSTPIFIKITEESSMELGGSTSTLPSSDRAVFLDNKLVSAATTSWSIALTIALVKCAELCLQQPWKISSSSDGGIFGNPRYTGVLSNLDENLDEFRAWCPVSTSDVLWTIQPLIGCGIPISTTSQNFSSIRPSKLRETSN